MTDVVNEELGQCGVVEPHNDELVSIRWVQEGEQKVWLKSWRRCLETAMHTTIESHICGDLVFRQCDKHHTQGSKTNADK